MAPVKPSMRRRDVLKGLGTGSVVMALGGETYALADEAGNRAARSARREDGRSRLPPGQKLIERMRPMGGDAGNPAPGDFRLKVYGEVERPSTYTMGDLLEMPQTEQTCDVHCVTRWSVLDSHWTGVRLSQIAQRVGLRSTAHYVIFEAAHGYTSNIPLAEALKPNVLVAHRYEGAPLSRKHGPPARALVPDLYFWKSAKWLTAIRFTATDHWGFWEKLGYRNGADPWKQQRHWLGFILPF